MAITNLSSYLPKLVKTFNVSEINTGQYAGAVSSSLSVSRIISSIIWGFICDKFGRKTSLLWSGSGLAIATLLFGFTMSFIWTVVTRSFQGMFVGLIVITKALIGDIANNSNLATGLSFIFAANNIGYIIGPSMAGFLVFPAEKYQKVFAKNGFFDIFKVLLPNIIISSGLIIVLLVAAVYIPGKKRVKVKVDLLNLQSSSQFLCEPNSIDDLKSDESENLQSSRQFQFESVVSDDFDDTKSDENPLIKDQTILKMHNENNLRCDSVIIDTENSKPTTKYRKLLRNKIFILSTVLYGMFSMTTVGYEDMFPVFAATDIKYNGLGMTTSDIGLIYLVTGITVIIIQFSIVNKAIDRFGSKKIFSFTTLFFSILVFLLPTMAKIKNKIGLWISLWITQCLMRTLYSTGILCVNIFINNSVESEQLGVANGIGSSVASIGRSIGSVVFGLAFSWSLDNVKKRLAMETSLGFPFNEYFTFILISVSSMFVMLAAFFLPQSINHKKTLRKAEENK
ncbi:uncharacterized protein LOC101239231 isoform X2 [Hydra vulgaris]|nr:protein ZINC INDUCED FACILITATOR-LIKE 1 isoform X2 [Hydra vulgaris]